MNKILISGIVGGVVFFLLGWLVYGIIMMDFMSANAGPAASMQKQVPDMFHLVIANLAWGFLYAIVLGKWSSGLSIAQGAMRGALLALMVALFIDLTLYATTTMFTMECILADIVAMTVIGAIGGAAVTWVLRMKKSEA
ncbi:hypothetical protein [Pedobacter frigoris]|uniref:DUF1761 domain-containing protein n=1 Tax=Pedobacter frigoris TaxID=2571272 RepID=A0A4U1CQL3_9SPHI|nr:hypothetical protein [Pedobacter frigoris]TKC09636.1 hypothetical protein FA047_06015 [Pedobacter frigoris]